DVGGGKSDEAVHHRAVDRFEAGFHLTPQLANFPLDLVEAPVDFVETAIDLLESAVDFAAKVVQPRLCPALPDQVHDCTVNIPGARGVRRMSSLCHTYMEVAAVDPDGGGGAGVVGHGGGQDLGGDVGLVLAGRRDQLLVAVEGKLDAVGDVQAR